MRCYGIIFCMYKQGEKEVNQFKSTWILPGSLMQHVQREWPFLMARESFNGPNDATLIPPLQAETRSLLTAAQVARTMNWTSVVFLSDAKLLLSAVSRRSPPSWDKIVLVAFMIFWMLLAISIIGIVNGLQWIIIMLPIFCVS